MRIALIHYTGPEIVGGVESVLDHHARLMRAAGHRVRLIAGRGLGDLAGIETAAIPLADSRDPRILAAKEALDRGEVPADFEALVDELTAALEDAWQGVDIAIAHNVCSLHKNLALTAAIRRAAGRPNAPRLILWHHDLAWTAAGYCSELHPGWPWQLLREQWSEVRPQHVVVSALRRAELAELLGLEASQIAVVPSGLDVVAFLRLEPTTAGMIEQLGLLAADPLMLLPARLTRRKNVELALQVAAAMAPAFTRPVLLVTGPLGPHNPANVAYLDELQRLTRRLGLAHEADEPGAAAWFLAAMNGGTLSEGVVSDLYRLADLLLFPSWEEGFGIPLLEAGLAGIPVFCADIKPLREIAHGAATFFAPDEAPGTVAALIAAELRQSGVFHLRRRVRRDYTWQGVYRRHIAPLLEGSDE